MNSIGIQSKVIGSVKESELQVHLSSGVCEVARALPVLLDEKCCQLFVPLHSASCLHAIRICSIVS